MALWEMVAADAVAGAYLLGWALRRERRDKAAVLTVGVMLELCALALLVIAAVRPAGPPERPVPTPTAPPSPAGPAGPTLTV